MAAVYRRLIFSIDPLVTLGIVLFSLAVLFQLVTLPVEINASSRALKMLESTGILGVDEKKGCKKSTYSGSAYLCGSSGGIHSAASETDYPCRR